MVELTFLTMLNPEIGWHGVTLLDMCRTMPHVSRLILEPTAGGTPALSFLRLAADRFPGEVVPGCMMAYDVHNFAGKRHGMTLSQWLSALGAAARNERRMYFDFEWARNRLRKRPGSFTADAFVEHLPPGLEEVLIYPSPLNTKDHDEGIWLTFLERVATLRPEVKLVDLSHNGSDVWNPARRRYRADSLQVVGGQHRRLMPLLQFSMTDAKTGYWWYPQLEWGTRYLATERGHIEQMLFCLEDERLVEAAVFMDDLARRLKGSE
jgi:hypothetical protein